MDLLNKIFGRTKRNQPLSSTMTFTDATKIVQEYGAALEATAMAKQFVVDASSLPHPKDRIKQALVFSIRSTTDPKMRERLKNSYLSLAAWQNGVGNTPVQWSFTTADLNRDISELIAQVNSQMPGMERWVQVIKTETTALKSELQQLGLW